MKKIKFSHLVLFIAILLIIAGLFFHIFRKKDSNVNNDEKKENEISEEVLMKYVNYVPIITYDNFNIFQDKYVEVRNVPVQLLANQYYSTISENDVIGCGMNLSREECEETDGIYLNDLCYLEGYTSNINYYFNNSKINSDLKKNYNIDDVDINNVSNGVDCSCTLEDENYYCTCDLSTIDIGYYMNYIKYDSYKIRDDELLITVKYLYAKYTSDDESGNMYITVYDKKDGNELGYIHSFNSDEAFNNFESKASLYTVTFVKNTDDSYYWYGIEPVIIDN